MYMTIYELIQILPYDSLMIIANFISEETSINNLLYMINVNPSLRLLNKEHYVYQYPYFFCKIKDNLKLKIKLINSIVKNKIELCFQKYISSEGIENLMKKRIIKYKNKKYKNLFIFIKENIINYGSENLLPYLLEIN